MEAVTPFVSIMALVVVIYPFIAIGRIWLYSKQQVELLRQIQQQLASS